MTQSNKTVRQARDVNDYISIRDFGAVGDGIADDTIAIQAAFNSGAKYIFITTPSAHYKITSALTITGSGITIFGTNKFSALIKQYTASAKIFVNSGAWNNFSNFSLDYAVTPTNGATAIESSGSNSHFSDFVVNKADIGIKFLTGSAQMADNFQIFAYVTSGILCTTINDVFCSKFILNAGNATNGSLGGIRLSEKAEACIFTDGDVLLGVRSLTTDAASYALNVRPAYNNFTNIFFDSDALGSSVNNMVETEFIGCWFSGGRTDTGYAGLTLTQTDSIAFTNTRFFNNGGAGCLVGPTAKRITFDICTFESNSVTAGVGVAHGLSISPNCTDFAVRNCIAHNGLYTGQQGYGILVNAGSSDHYQISGNKVTGNVQAAGISDAGTGTSGKVTDNDGYNPVGASVVTYGTSPFTVTAGHSPQTLYVYGGVVSNVSSGGQTVATSSPCSIQMGPNESVVITASSAPTMTRFIH